jgi:hypothetical protein
MSAGNFGWFNVVMANVDNMLDQRRIRGEAPPETLGDLFQELVGVSSRIREYVLDHNAIDVLKLDNRDQLKSAREMLYGQLPVSIDQYSEEERQGLLKGLNEFDEPVALLFRRVEWDDLEAAQALQESKFVRDKGYWRLGGIDQPLDLKQLLSNLGTYAIHETKGKNRSDGKHTLLIPLRQGDFVQLVGLLYPHPAAEDAARALWRKFLAGQDLPDEDATHIGPSMAMIGRLDLRHRQQGQRTLVFRDPDMGEAHSKAIGARKGEKDTSRAQAVLVGAMRVLDQNWDYDAVAPGFGDDEVVAISTAPKTAKSATGGLVMLDGLKLHPKGRLILCWVRNVKELERICRLASAHFSKEGRFPVVALTTSRALLDQYESPTTDVLRNAPSYLMLYQLSSTEEHALYQVGLPSTSCHGFKLNDQVFTTSFSNRLQGIIRPFMQAVVDWRKKLDGMGRIAWPMRASGSLKDAELMTLITGWCHLMLKKDEPLSLADLDEKSPVNVEDLVAVLAKLRIPPKARASGYEEGERACLFSAFDDRAEVRFPPFLSALIKRLLVESKSWTFDAAKREWFWGYTWEGAKERIVFQEWMNLLCEMRFAEESPSDGKAPSEYRLCTRSKLSNLAVEASNWLVGEYSQVVAKMGNVFGAGRVQDLFGPEESSNVGTKTKLARRQIAEAHDSLSALNIEETSALFDQPADVLIEKLRACSRHRRGIIRKVDFVFNRDRYLQTQHDDNLRTLNFDDDKQELWCRIRRAELFMEYVSAAEQRIRRRVTELQNEIKSSVTETFPVQLFTLSLEKIAHILDAALSAAPDSGKTVIVQTSEPGTLHYYLRNLQISEASATLDKLAAELGLDLRTGQTVPLEEIDGQIIRTFRALKKTHADIGSGLDIQQKKLSVIRTQITDAPSDFIYPKETPPLDNLVLKPELIRDELEETRTEEVDRLRKDHDAPARLGNFQPLMDKAIRLFDNPKKYTQELAGQIQTVENVIVAYRRKLLENPRLHEAMLALNALKRIKRQELAPEITLATLEAQDSLKSCVEFTNGRLEAWTADGDTLLNDTGVSFERWARIVGSIEADNDPALEPNEAEALVNHGFLRRTYSLGE